VHHLLVTNDFPPRRGGIQSYLFELWRRLPPGSATVLTRDRPGAAEWDAGQTLPVVRARDPALLPRPGLRRRIDRLAAQVGAELVMFDPVFPLGLLGPRLALPYGLVLHGGEMTMPAQVPGVRGALARVLRGARIVVACGGYVAEEARRVGGAGLPIVEIPPAVDAARFRPLSAVEREQARRRFGLPVQGRLVLSVGRLVPRKGMDVLIRAAARVREGRPDLCVAIAGGGRDRARLSLLDRRLGRPVRLLGPVADDRLGSLYGCADLFALLCRDRWGGLAEGYGVVFLEAAAAGLPQLAGASGGSARAVLDDVTGCLVDDARSVEAVAAQLARLLDDAPLRARLGVAARARILGSLSADALAARLDEALLRVMGGAPRGRAAPPAAREDAAS
jgi:phosphatidylinositol alpha-1,6-mannosyltransferase